MDRGPWRATVPGVARSWTPLKWLSTHAHINMLWQGWGCRGPLIMEAGCHLAGWSGSRVHDAAVKVSPGAGPTPKHIGTDVKRIYILAGRCPRT